MTEDGVEWYYAVGLEQRGPVSPAAMATLIASGSVGRDTLVWVRPMPGWEPLGRTALAVQLAPPPALPPVPQPRPLPAAPPPAPLAASFAHPPASAPEPLPPVAPLPPFRAPDPVAPDPERAGAAFLPAGSAKPDPHPVEPRSAVAVPFVPVAPAHHVPDPAAFLPRPPRPAPTPAWPGEPEAGTDHATPTPPDASGPAPTFAPATLAGSTSRAEVGPNRSDGPVRYRIDGTLMQTVTVELPPEGKLFSQTSAMAWMSDGIRMDTHTGGGFMAGLVRSFAGGSFFITEFTATVPGSIAFAPRFPGTILPFRLEAGQSLICRKETFLFAETGVALEIAWQRRLGAGLFGGEGFILQKVTGPGTVWLDLSGEVVERELAPGERLFVNVGHVGIQDPSIQFDVQMVKGFKNALFGGEGLFLATLTGPGRVWLQSMPIMNLAEEIGRYLPSRPAEAAAGAGGALAAATAVGGVLGSFLGGGSNKTET